VRKVTTVENPQSSKGKRFAVFDIDGTLFRSGLYREVFFELIRMGALPEKLHQQLADKETAWQKRAHGRAFGEFEQSMAEIFDEQLPNLKISDFEQAAERVINQHKDNVYVYTRNLVKSLGKQGFFLIAISGSQTEVLEPFAQHYGFDYWVGQQYERGTKYFTGHIRKTHKGKDKFLSEIIHEKNLSLTDSIAVGDSGGDIDMLSMVEQPIAFNPENNLYQTAIRNSWKIVIERKNMIYELEKGTDEYTLSQANSH